MWSGVWHQPLSVQCSLLSLCFNLQSHAVFYLALVSFSVCDLLYSCSTVPCRSVIEVVPCFGSATLSHVCWVFLRNVVCCGAGLLGKSCYSQVVRRNCCLCPVLRGAVSHVAVSSRASGQASGATFVLCQSANESEVQHCASQMSSVICYITDQCSVRTMCSCQFWVRNTTNVRGKRGVLTAAWRNSTLVGQFRVLARDGRCGSATHARLGQQFLQFVFWCESVQGGPATCVGACECSNSCWIKYATLAVTV